MSRFSTLKSSGLAVLQTITDFAEIQPVSQTMILSTTPGAYPAALCALFDPEKLEPDAPPSFGHLSIKYRCKFGILILANGDGQVTGDADNLAWTLTDKVIDAFSAPAWAPTTAGVFDAWPCDVAAPITVRTDAGLTGIYIPITVDIEWRT